MFKLCPQVNAFSIFNNDKNLSFDLNLYDQGMFILDQDCYSPVWGRGGNTTLVWLLPKGTFIRYRKTGDKSEGVWVDSEPKTLNRECTIFPKHLTQIKMREMFQCP